MQSQVTSFSLSSFDCRLRSYCRKQRDGDGGAGIMNINELNSPVCSWSSAGRTRRWLKKNKSNLMFRNAWPTFLFIQPKFAGYLLCASYQSLAKWRIPYPLSSGNSKSINAQVIMTVQGYAFIKGDTQSSGNVKESIREDVTASSPSPDTSSDSPWRMSLGFDEGWCCEGTLTRTPNFPRKSWLYPLPCFPHCGLLACPPKICPSPNLQHLWRWSYLEIGCLQIYSS